MKVFTSLLSFARQTEQFRFRPLGGWRLGPVSPRWPSVAAPSSIKRFSKSATNLWRMIVQPEGLEEASQEDFFSPALCNVSQEEDAPNLTLTVCQTGWEDKLTSRRNTALSAEKCCELFFCVLETFVSKYSRPRRRQLLTEFGGFGEFFFLFLFPQH